MTVSLSYISFILILVLNFVQGTLTPNGNVSVDCGSAQTFACAIPDKAIEWTTSGLSGIGRGPFRARLVAYSNPRITSPDNGGDRQISVSSITISGFNRSDNGGTIQCINVDDGSVQGMASISVDLLPLPPPTNVTATVESCNVTLQWDQPSEPNDVTTSVNCTPPSPGCAECTTSPCTITGLNPSTEYEFTVTLNSGGCRTSMNTTTASTMDLNPPTNLRAAVESCDNITLQWDQPSQPNDITTSVSCTPPLADCAECTTSPCNITGLNSNIEYVFTVTLNSGGCRANMSTTTVTTMDSCTPPERPSNNSTDTSPSTSPLDTSASLAALVLLLLPIPLLYPLGVLIANLVFFKDKSYCEVFWCCYCWRKDKLYECNSTELREHREEAAYQNVPKKKVVTNGDEIKEPKRSRQEQVVTDEAFKIQEGKDGGVITDETVQQQGTPDGHHKQKRSRKHKEEVQYQNLGVAKKEQAVTNGDDMKKPKKSKQETIATNEPVRQQEGKDGVVNTGNVMQQQGNPDGIQYADLDFSEHQTGRIVILPLVDPVTYADV